MRNINLTQPPGPQPAFQDDLTEWSDLLWPVIEPQQGSFSFQIEQLFGLGLVVRLAEHLYPTEKISLFNSSIFLDEVWFAWFKLVITSEDRWSSELRWTTSPCDTEKHTHWDLVDRLLTRTTWEFEPLHRRSPVTLGEGRGCECSEETPVRLSPAAGGGYAELLAIYSVTERIIHVSYWLTGITKAIVHPEIILFSYTESCMAFFLLWNTSEHWQGDFPVIFTTY